MSGRKNARHGIVDSYVRRAFVVLRPRRGHAAKRGNVARRNFSMEAVKGRLGSLRASISQPANSSKARARSN